MKSPKPKTADIRWCTGGCDGSHHAHFYSVDPVDGPLGREFLCPGDLGECREFVVTVVGREVGTLHGFIAAA